MTSTAGSETGDVRVVVSPEAAAAAAEVEVELEALAGEAVTAVAQRIDLPIATVSIDVRPGRVIRAIGLGGHTDPTTADVSIWLNPRHRHFQGSLRTWFPALLAHGLHHAARILDGPGYGESLVEAIVTEGLADVFGSEVFPRTPRAPWTRALAGPRLCRWWHKAVTQSERRATYDHGAWFFGRSSIPTWAGYSIGYEVVQRFLHEHPRETAASLVGTPAEAIVGTARPPCRYRRDVAGNDPRG